MNNFVRQRPVLSERVGQVNNRPFSDTHVSIGTSHPLDYGLKPSAILLRRTMLDHEGDRGFSRLISAVKEERVYYNLSKIRSLESGKLG
jgi:hypothetical protein